jgi:ribonuclease D
LAKSGASILSVIEKAMEILEEDFIVLPEHNGYTTVRGVEELLSAYVQIRSEELKIEPSVLADRKQIHSFVTHYEQKLNMEDHLLFQGWRKELIGAPMFSLLSGKVGLKIDPSGQVCLTDA